LDVLGRIGHVGLTVRTHMKAKHLRIRSSVLLPTFMVRRQVLLPRSLAPAI
jgi:hypothetical protein